MTAATPAQRKAAERQRRASDGLTRLELYAHPEDIPAIRAAAAKMTELRAQQRRKAAERGKE